MPITREQEMITVHVNGIGSFVEAKRIPEGTTLQDFCRNHITVDYQGYKVSITDAAGEDTQATATTILTDGDSIYFSPKKVAGAA